MNTLICKYSCKLLRTNELRWGPQRKSLMLNDLHKLSRCETPCQALFCYLSVTFSLLKKLAFYTCQDQDIHNMKWTPRNQRWSQEERKEKQIQARKNRVESRILWEKLYSLRAEIEAEISQKKLARIKLWD